jgi:Holliday junction resolvasome RuvABC endonuclease subunit
MPVPKGTKLSQNDTRLDCHIPADLKRWLTGYAARRKSTLTAIVRGLLEQERQQKDGAIGQEGES